MQKTYLTFFVFLLCTVASAFAGPPLPAASPSETPEEESSHDLLTPESTYTFDSDFTKSSLGHQSSLYNDFNYAHRFLIKGKWYFRAGFEYERYDFGGTGNGLPNHLQALYG